jgi:RimJ/RimL family protein N-acetyltransferase
MPSFPDLRQPLTGEGIALRIAAERDIPEILIAHQDDGTLYRRLGMARPPSGAELGRRTELAGAELTAGVGAWLTILAADPTTGELSDECRGQIDVGDVDWDHRRAQLEIWIAPRDRGRGLAAAALELAGRWLLRDCGLERVQLLVDPANATMRRAAAAAGYAEEGTLRGYLLDRGGRADVTMLSLVRADL